ncbi:MAG TPA: hypothetical protein PLK90_02560 [Clostridiales bacterium]|jgi:anti-anti-sigma regulatory factor|nr:hypothetical protein [Clostridiales bacterium]HQP69260.1 hypothetical protein [Clostridiales bacterium]
MIIEKKGKTADIVISSDLKDERSEEFVSTLSGLVEEGIHRINIDFENVTGISSNALAGLVILCDKPDIEFSFRKVTVPLMNIFGIVKLNKQVLLEDNIP